MISNGTPTLCSKRCLAIRRQGFKKGCRGEDVKKYVLLSWANDRFGCGYIVFRLTDEQHLLKVVSISKGALNKPLAHPREIFRPVITYSAHAFILVHNL